MNKNILWTAIAVSLCFVGGNVQADTSSLVKEHFKHLLEFYQDLHENPEVSGQEVRTAGKVAGEFRELGLEVIEHVGGHGVVGILHNGNGPVTLVRSEIDALPVPEDTHAAYASRVQGVMHACGHDFHTTSLVGTAYVMSKTKDRWKGTLIFVAQPAEETAKGAFAMIKDGFFKKVPKPDQTIALHTSGLYKRGTVGITSGAALANVDSVDVIFKGKGTHGSMPEQGIDPFIMAAEMTLRLQTIVSREKAAAKPAVISVGSIHGGMKHNIIPDEVKMQLTVRTYDDDVRRLILRRIPEMAKGIAIVSGAPAPVVEFPEKIDSLYNDPKLVTRMRELLIAHLGKDRVLETEPVMGGEDFGEFGRAAKVPTLFFWVGEKNEKDPLVINHSPRFLPDFDGTLPLAIDAMTTSLFDLHKKI